MKSVVCLGCAGYLGSSITQHLLNEGHSVAGIDTCIYNNFSIPRYFCENYQNFTFYPEDIRDLTNPGKVREKIRSADCIINMAAIVGAPACDKQPGSAREVNDKAVHDLISILGPNQRLIYANSNSAYGFSDKPVTEESTLNPLSVYADTKLWGEHWTNQHPGGVSLRLGTAFGGFSLTRRPRLDLLVPDFVEKILGGRLEIFEPHFIRNFVGVIDVVRCVRFMMDRPHLHGVFNLNHPDANISKGQLAELICKAVNPLAELVLVDGSDTDQRNCAVSCEKIQRLGFVFRHDLIEGIKETAAFLRSPFNKKLGPTMRNA